ncbi:hypothetical protein RFI_31205, partial [Reticulomyxa filosa]
MGACASTSQDLMNEDAIFQKYKLDKVTERQGCKGECEQKNSGLATQKIIPFEKWSTEQVYQWILSCENGKLRHTAKHFKREQIDGSLLLWITDEHLRNDLKMKSLKDRLRFQKALLNLCCKETKNGLYHQSKSTKPSKERKLPLGEGIENNSSTNSIQFQHLDIKQRNSNSLIISSVLIYLYTYKYKHTLHMYINRETNQINKHWYVYGMKKHPMRNMKGSNNNSERQACQSGTDGERENANLSVVNDNEWSEEDAEVVDMDTSKCNANFQKVLAPPDELKPTLTTASSSNVAITATNANHSDPSLADHYQSVNQLHFHKQKKKKKGRPINMKTKNSKRKLQKKKPVQCRFTITKVCYPRACHNCQKVLLSLSLSKKKKKLKKKTKKKKKFEMKTVNGRAPEWGDVDTEHTSLLQEKSTPRMWESDPKVNTSVNMQIILAYELARTFHSRLSILETQARQKLRLVQGYNGYFGKDIFEHMQHMKMDCCLVQNLMSLPSVESLPPSKNSSGTLKFLKLNPKTAGYNNGHCIHKDKHCCFVNCELLLNHGYFTCVGQKTRGRK